MKREHLEAEIASRFKAAGFEDPGLEARHLLKELGEPRDLEARAFEWTRHRLNGIPLAYLSGRKGFYKHEFAVTSGVLVPRPETEHVIEVALRRKAGELKFIADLGCGSGCLGLSLLAEFPSARLEALDISARACEVTRLNARNLGLETRVEVLQQSVEAYVPAHSFELIVANPPYIALGDLNVQHSVHKHEPHEALYSGPTGLEAIESWTHWAARHLSRGGVFVCEIGAGQSPAARAIMAKAGLVDVAVDPDLARIERVVSARRR